MPHKKLLNVCDKSGHFDLTIKNSNVMSVMILRDVSMGSVLKTLQSPSIRTERRHTIDMGTAMGLPFHNPNHLYEYDRLSEAVRLFVQRCIFFNNEAHRLRYGGEVCEPVTKEQLDALYGMGKVVNYAQLFKTLQCIDYNAAIEDYIHIEYYELRDTFTEWKATMKRLTDAVAYAIAWEQTDAEGCKWG